MGGNIPGGNFLGGNFPGVIHQEGVWLVGIFREGVFLIPLNIYIVKRIFLHKKEVSKLLGYNLKIFVTPELSPKVFF